MEDCRTCDGDGYNVEGSEAQPVFGLGTRETCADCGGTGEEE